MGVKQAYRDRSDVEVAILDALIARGSEGMTVLELRSVVDADIDTVEAALGALREADLVRVERQGDRLLFHPADRVVSAADDDSERTGPLAALRERLGL